MNLTFKIILVVLIFLAISSGITKIMLMPQDARFFGAYGFSNAMLITFGATQFISGILMIIPKTRLYGAIIVAITFLISLALLVMDGKLLIAGITLIATALLGWVAKSRSIK